MHHMQKWIKDLNIRIKTIRCLKDITKRNENLGPHKNLYTNVRCCNIHNSQEAETTQVSINRVDKQKIQYIDTMTLFSHKKKRGTDKHATTWMHFENITPSGRKEKKTQRPHIV